MPTIVMMIPRMDVNMSRLRTLISTASAVVDLDFRWESLPFIGGECQLKGFANMILVQDVSWGSNLPEELSTDGRRTVHFPQHEPVRIKRKLDRSTGQINQLAASAAVSSLPWEIYFLRGSGGNSSPTGAAGLVRGLIGGGGDDDMTMQYKFMTLKLFDPLITKYSFDLGDNEADEQIEVVPSKMEWVYEVTTETQDASGKLSVTYDMQRGLVT